MKRERDGDEKKIKNFTDMLFSHFLSFHDPCMLSPSEEMFFVVFFIEGVHRRSVQKAGGRTDLARKAGNDLWLSLQ